MRSHDSAPRQPPPLSPSPVKKLSLFLSLPVCRRLFLLTGGGEERVGEEPNHTTARKPGYLSINQIYLSILSGYTSGPSLSLCNHRLVAIGPKSKISSSKEKAKGRWGYKISNESHEAHRELTAEQRDRHILREEGRKETASCPCKMKQELTVVPGHPLREVVCYTHAIAAASGATGSDSPYSIVTTR